MLQKKWYDKYLPFVARSPEMQLEWIISSFKKKHLSDQEITPYIRLFLTDEKDEKRGILSKLLSELAGTDIDNLISAADIYDLPKIFSLVAKPTIAQAIIALKKTPPPYEKTIQTVLDKVFWALNNYSEDFLREAGEALLASGDAPAHFEKEFKRFQEILEDEKILSALYPRASSSL